VPLVMLPNALLALLAALYGASIRCADDRRRIADIC